MDSFYKLSPSQQSGALLSVFGVLVIFVLISFTLYFSRVSALESDLTSGFEAIEELRSLKKKYNYERKKFAELENIVRRGLKVFDQNLSSRIKLILLESQSLTYVTRRRRYLQIVL